MCALCAGVDRNRREAASFDGNPRERFGRLSGRPDVRERPDFQGFLNGAQGRNRTTDTRIFSPLLYRLSYLGTKDGEVIGARLRPVQRARHAGALR
jgi:hypothetical protein